MLFVDLVRHHDEGLHAPGGHRAQQVHAHHDHGHRQHGAPFTLVEADDEEHGGGDGQHHQQTVLPQGDVDVGEARAVDHGGGVGIEQGELLEEEVQADHEEEDDAQHLELQTGHGQQLFQSFLAEQGLPRRFWGRRRRAFAASAEEAAHEAAQARTAQALAARVALFLLPAGFFHLIFGVGLLIGLILLVGDLLVELGLAQFEQGEVEQDVDHGEAQHDVDEHAVDLLPEFQAEDVEGHVLGKDGVRDVEIRAVEELQDLEPQPVGHPKAGDQAEEGGEAQRRLVHFLFRLGAQVAADLFVIGALHAEQVGVAHSGDDEKGRQAVDQLCDDLFQEDRHIAQLGEPQPVRDEAGQGRHHGQHHQNDGDDHPLGWELLFQGNTPFAESLSPVSRFQ